MKEDKYQKQAALGKVKKDGHGKPVCPIPSPENVLIGSWQ